MAATPIPRYPVAATVAKKKKPAPPAQTSNVGAMDPFGAIVSGQVTSPSDIARLMGLIQPDYSGVPAIDLDSLRTAAHTTAQMQMAPYKAALDTERQQTLDDQRISQGAATAFTKALTEMLQGGQTGQAGMDYAKENYGGSYLGAIAGQMGTQLFGQITAGFNDQLKDISSRLAELISKSPEIENDIYDQISKAAFDEQGNAIKMAELDVQTKVKAAAVILKQANDDRKALTELAKAMGKGGTNKIVTTKDGVFMIDPATGTTTQLTKTSSADGTVSYRSGASDVVRINPDGTVTTVYKAPAKPGKAPAPGAAGARITAATKAGNTALSAVLAKVWASTPGARQPPDWDRTTQGDYENSQEYFNATEAAKVKAQQSFGSAMYRVMQAMKRDLRLIHYSQAQIKQMAFEIVSTQITPPKGYDPKAPVAVKPQRRY